MATTTSNQDLGITTTTSDHVAETQGATDVCFDPPMQKPSPHPNEVPSTRATEHTSDKTVVSDGNVVREGDAIGAPSDPAHPDLGGGVVSGTYREEARIVSGSPNVQTEGVPLGRNTDPTTQNSANTVGKMEGGDPAEELARLESEKKKACSLETSSAECTHGRKAGDEHLLEVVTHCAIKLVAKRKNAKTPSEGPECEPGDHTKWEISRWRNGNKLREETLIGDEQELDSDWFQYNDVSSVALDPGTGKWSYKFGEMERDGMAAGAANQAEQDRFRQQEGATATDGAVRAQGQRRVDAIDDLVQTGGAVVQAGHAVHSLNKTAVNIQQFIEVWNAGSNPVTVKIELFACSGGDRYEIRSYPGREVEFTLGGETLEKIKAVLTAVEKVLRGVKKIASLAGAGVSVLMEVAELPNVTLKVAWKELTEANAAIRKLPHHTDREWELVFEFAKLIHVKADFNVAIVAFLNLFAPSVGSTAARALNYIGAEATIGVKIDIEVVPAFWARRQAGASRPSWGGGCTIKWELFFNVTIRWRSSLEIAGGVVVKGEPRFGFEVEGLDIWQAVLILLATDIEIGFRGYVKVDVLWWKVNESVNYFPEACKVKLGEARMRPLALLKG